MNRVQSKLYWSAGILLVSLLAAVAPAGAVSVSGTPDCRQNGPIFLCDISFPSVSSSLGVDEPFIVDITLADMQHVELLDSDPSNEAFIFGYGVDNSANSTTTKIRIDIAFLDENGSVLDPPGALAPFVFQNVTAGAIGRFTSTLLTTIDFTPVLFHQLRVTLTPDASLELTDFDRLGFSGLDDTSNVGTWIPEPGTATLVCIGLVGLAMQGRPRRADLASTPR